MADVAQLVEHSLGKGEVTGSNPVISSRSTSAQRAVQSGQAPEGVQTDHWSLATVHCFQAGVTQW